MVTIPSYTWGTIDTAAATAAGGGGYAVRRKRYLEYLLSCFVLLLG